MRPEGKGLSGLGVFCGRGGFTGALLDLIPRCALFVEEPAMVKNQIDCWWNKLSSEMSGRYRFVDAAGRYLLRPEILEAQLVSHPGPDDDELAWWMFSKMT